MKLVRVERVPHPSDERGWHTEAVEAWEGDERRGFLRVSWIPADEMHRRYGTTADYAREIAGYSRPTPEILADLRERHERFRAFHAQPYVAYVHVAEMRRRRGVATALYVEAALWLTERGLSLAASDLQADGVQGLWRRLRAHGDLVSTRLPDGRLALTHAHATRSANPDSGS